jgi:hypothetical protein
VDLVVREALPTFERAVIVVDGLDAAIGDDFDLGAGRMI